MEKFYFIFTCRLVEIHMHLKEHEIYTGSDSDIIVAFCLQNHFVFLLVLYGCVYAISIPVNEDFVYVWVNNTNTHMYIQKYVCKLCVLFFSLRFVVLSSLRFKSKIACFKPKIPLYLSLVLITNIFFQYIRVFFIKKESNFLIFFPGFLFLFASKNKYSMGF